MRRINIGVSIHHDILAELTRIAAREREAGGRDARTRNRIIEDALAEYIRTQLAGAPQATLPPPTSTREAGEGKGAHVSHG
jgi:peptide subunit release factor 1 (eRF1)